MRQHAKGCMHSLLLCAAVLFVLTVLFNLAFRPIFIEGDSMNPTMQDGEWILVCRLDAPSRGDLTVTNTHNAPGARLIKRAIAFGGDTVDIDFITGQVTVNGVALEEPYLADKTIRGGDVSFPLTVPAGCVFLLGDNRTNSVDSRYAEVGCIPQDDLLGTIWLRFLPLPIHVLQ